MKRCAIIGGGISGLSAAFYLQQKAPDVQIDVYDSQARFGGVIKTEHVQGCIVEAGPDSFLTQKRAASELCSQIGMETSLVGSNDATRKTFIFHDQKLKPLPEGFFLMVPTRVLPFLTTDLISWPGKLDALHDFFEYPEQEDCTVGDFIEKRFGSEILQQIAEPLLAGVYGADIHHLSLQSALPQLWDLQKQGSLIWKLLRAGRAPNESLFTTLANGMESLPRKLKDTCTNVQWKSELPVRDVTKSQGRWRIGSESYDVLLSASSSLPEIETERCREIRSLMDSIRRNSAIVIVLCFENMEREGFGWLVPSAERRSVLACTYVSNKFPARSPKSKCLVRLFIGGKETEQWIHRSDQEIYQEAIHELKRIAQIE